MMRHSTAVIHDQHQFVACADGKWPMELTRSRNRTLPVPLSDQLLAEFHETTLKIASLPPRQRLRVLPRACRRARHERGDRQHHSRCMHPARLLPMEDLARC